MGLLDGLRVFASSWEVTGTEKLSAADIKSVERAEVVSSKFGLSACFFMKAGGKKYMPLSRDVEAEEGDEIDLKSAKVLTLSKDGEDDILRLDYQID